MFLFCFTSSPLSSYITSAWHTALSRGFLFFPPLAFVNTGVSGVEGGQLPLKRTELSVRHGDGNWRTQTPQGGASPCDGAGDTGPALSGPQTCKKRHKSLSFHKNLWILSVGNKSLFFQTTCFQIGFDHKGPWSWSLVYMGCFGDLWHSQDSLTPYFSHWELWVLAVCGIIVGLSDWGKVWLRATGEPWLDFLEFEWRHERFPLLPPLCAQSSACGWDC